MKKEIDKFHSHSEIDIGLQPSFELSMGLRDGSIWAGPRVAGFVFIGAVCIGIAGRFSGDLRSTGEAAYDNARRMSVDGLAILEIPFKIGKWSLVPGLAVGGGWVFIHALVSDAEGLTDNTIGFRMETALTAAYQLKEHLYLSPGLSFDVLLFGRHDYITRYDIRVGVDRLPLEIPGAPLFMIRIGLGIRYVF